MRRYDIDSLRVIAFALLILYHVGMFFVPWSFHLKNEVVYPDLGLPMLFLNQWRLPLLFVISGMGTWFALQKRTGGQFAAERLRRLFVPFLFGCLVIVPPQIYLERLVQGVDVGRYFFDFWPVDPATGPYPEGDVSWHHLWFILYLLIFSLLLAPAFVWLRKHPRAWLIRATQWLAGQRWGLYAFAILPLVWQLWLGRRFPHTNALVGDWHNLLGSCTLFFTGFLLLSAKERFWENVTRNRRSYLIVGVAGFGLLLGCWELWRDFPHRSLMIDLLRTINMWSWILALFGFAARYLNRPSRALSYANEAVYPFYVLHQTVIIVLGYYLMNVSMGFWPKFSIMVVGTFAITWLIYEVAIRRWRVTRWLFGLRPRSH